MDTLRLLNLKDAEIVKAVIYALSGLIIWDFFSSLRFDLDILHGRTRLSWSLGVYLLARYASLLFVGGVIPQAESTTKVDCQAVWNVILLATTFQKCWGQALFIIRACAIWSWNRLVISSLLILWLLHWAFSLANLPLVRMTWIDHPIIPGYGSCLASSYHWAIGVAYILTWCTDVAVFGLAAWRLLRLSHAVRSPFSKVLLNDGVAWCCLTVVPTTAAIVMFYAGKTVPAQSICLIISSTMHSLLACRAYRKLADFADALPASFCPRDGVANGTMLDPDTLARLAWMSGNYGNASESDVGTLEKEQQQARPLTEVLTMPRNPRRGLFALRPERAQQQPSPRTQRPDYPAVPPGDVIGVGVQVMTQSTSHEDHNVELPLHTQRRETMVMPSKEARQGSIATLDSSWSSNGFGGGSSSGGSDSCGGKF